MSEKKLEEMSLFDECSLFEECKLEEATHVEMGGKLHELNDNVQYFRNGDLLGVRWRDEYTFIPEQLFHILAIKPMKKIKQEPIEFEATFVKYDGKWHPLYSLDDGVSYQNCKKTKFRCVQILEEKK